MIFDFQCTLCNEVQKDVFVHKIDDAILCLKCGGETIRLFPSDSHVYIKTFPSEGIYLEHVSAEGKTFHSEKEMRKFEKDNNMELGALL